MLVQGQVICAVESHSLHLLVYFILAKCIYCKSVDSSGLDHILYLNLDPLFVNKSLNNVRLFYYFLFTSLRIPPQSRRSCLIRYNNHRSNFAGSYCSKTRDHTYQNRARLLIMIMSNMWTRPAISMRNVILAVNLVKFSRSQNNDQIYLFRFVSVSSRPQCFN